MHVTVQGPSQAQLQGHDRDPRDWDLVVKYARGSGEGQLTDSQHWTLYCHADGFGDLLDEPGILAEINDGYDWSHIRDSSGSAVARMANLLRSWGLS